MAILPNGGTFSYNGVQFVALYRSRISSKPTFDQAHRAVTDIEHTLELEGYVTGQGAGATTDAVMTSLRRNLTVAGAPLVYRNKGFGDLIVNSTALSPVKDVAWGPFPEVLEWVPLGGECYAARVKFRVVTRIPECVGARYTFTPMAFNYSQDFDIDADGFTTIRTTGYLEIPLTRAGGGSRLVLDTADRYREKVRPEVPLGFQRQSQSFKLSADKRRLDFTFVDVEQPAALPDGVTHIQATHRVESDLKSGFRQWMITVEATITLARGLPKTDALAIFLLILASRTKAEAWRQRGQGFGILPQRMVFEDDIFGRTARFSVTLKDLGGLSIKEILNLSGIWTPIEGTDWTRWRTSLAPYTGVRGWAGAQALPVDDAILDLCGGAAQPTVPQGGNVKAGGNASRPGGGRNPVAVNPRFPNAPSQPPAADFTQTVLEGLSPDNSWVHYRTRIHYGEKAHPVRHKPQLKNGQQAAAPGGVDATALDALADVVGAGLKSVSGWLQAPADVVQQALTPSRVITLTGEAVRLGYRASLPALTSVGGVAVTEMERQVSEEVVGSVGDLPIYGTTWSIDYLLPAPISSNLPVSANPSLRTEGTLDDQGSLTP
jgi:hypothetical protein